MKKEDKIIHSSLVATNLMDERLSPYATQNSQCIKVKHTHKPSTEFDIRWPFEKDIDRVLYSKSYSRYVDKTQALSFFSNVHITKRSLHVQWVSRIARQIGRGLNLNLDLIEAIALGHDLGHAPYGHVGEKAINDCLEERGFGYFNHNANSVRHLLFIERNGVGYNVSLQVLDGILCHNGEILSRIYKPDRHKTIAQFWDEYEKCWHIKNYSKKIVPMTLEGCVVRISDVISYVGKDIEDAIKVGIISEDDLPQDVVTVLGKDNKSMINRLIGDIVIHSYRKPYLEFSEEVYRALESLFQFISVHIHHHPTLIKENEKLTRLVKELYNAFYEDLIDDKNENHGIDLHVHKMVETYQQTAIELIVSDYLSGMTDSYALRVYEDRFLPRQHGEMIQDD
ncbi:deoxyguanosinetriphosphate triphosphohydrolase family protein [Candidatus Stoquefichus massiliensis]|uniref:deoxyguanosinetriphosphate triphosphohydrolase family protein n=1 Tax=Candidatus Stoquefichus massiliensis TaxID=1470350 RepID=UPI0004869E0F|nr:HD domain-containing protein [Candidatus Stoquefichus massiliensis]